MIEIPEPLNSYMEYPGPILLLAGPGTGKTDQLEKRIKYLLNERNVSPEEISVLTFTNTTARSMRKRLSQEGGSLSPDKLPKTITTIHSLGNKIIGQHPEVVGLPPDYKVLTDPDCRKVLLDDAATLVGVDRATSHETGECRVKGGCNEDLESAKCLICKRYEDILRRCSLLDYDDQIMLACRLLQSNETIAAQIREKTKFLLVDEYQDINKAQCDFIQLLSHGQVEGLFVVGDDEQSIYSFRGGNPKFIKEFEKYYGTSSKIGRLSKSWRCPEHILCGARSVVEHYYLERFPKPKTTFSDKIEVNNKIVIHDVPSEEYEANQIAGIIEASVKSMRSAIVIIPNSKYFPPIRQALLRRSLGYIYKMEPPEDGLIRFSALARWVRQKKDSVLLRYLLELVINNNDGLVSSLPLESKNLTEKRRHASERIAMLWQDISPTSSLYNILQARSTNPSNYPFEAQFKTMCLDKIELALNGPDAAKRKGLPKFLEISGLMVAPGRNPQRFLSEIDEWELDKQAAGSGGSYLPVEIYNMPSSKGLQAQVICVTGLSEGLFPRPDDSVEEKARLLYVAMTRAEEELHLFSCRKRSGSRTFAKKSFALRPSPFLSVIPDEHMDWNVVYLRKKGAKKKGNT